MAMLSTQVAFVAEIVPAATEAVVVAAAELAPAAAVESEAVAAAAEHWLVADFSILHESPTAMLAAIDMLCDYYCQY